MSGVRLIDQQIVAAGTARPESVAVVDAARRVTYRELLDRARTLAGELVAAGAGPGDLVGLWVDRTADAVTAMLGTLRAGAAYVPLDPAWPQDRVRQILADVSIRQVVTGGPVEDGLFAGAAVHDLRRTAAATAAMPELRTPRTEHDLAYAIYTSGSTGTPKAVGVEHRSIRHLVGRLSPMVGIGPDTTVLATSSFTFDVSVFELLAPLVAGGTVVVAGEADRLDPAAVTEIAAREGVDVVQYTPSMWTALLDAGLDVPRGATRLAAGEILPVDLVARLRAGGPVWNLYGPTEATIYASGLLASAPEHAGREAAGGASIGRPLPGYRLAIVDDDGRVLEGPGDGELLIGGAGLARGYLNRPDLTAAAFRPLPGEPGAVWYRTGDQARRDRDGWYFVLGRRDRQIKIHGARVEPAEIEHCLRRHPAVTGAAVYMVEQPNGRSRLTGTVTVAGGDDVSPTDLRRFAARHLPRHMVPQQVTVAASIPTSSSGKTDYAALQRQAAASRDR